MANTAASFGNMHSPRSRRIRIRMHHRAFRFLAVFMYGRNTHSVSASTMSNVPAQVHTAEAQARRRERESSREGGTQYATEASRAHTSNTTPTIKRSLAKEGTKRSSEKRQPEQQTQRTEFDLVGLHFEARADLGELHLLVPGLLIHVMPAGLRQTHANQRE